MYPILLEIGPITIYSLWIFIAIGFFVSLLIMNKLIQKSRLHLKFIADHSLVIFLGGLVMARTVFILKNLDLYFYEFETSSLVQIFYIWDKGLSPWGGILGIILTMLFFAYREKEDIKKWLDIFTVSILGAIAVSNIGAFLDGRNYGNETDLPWGIMIQTSIYAVPIHPTQIYAAIYSGLLTIILYNLFHGKTAKEPGNISIIALGGYSLFRFLEEFLRGDESNFFLGLREAQIFALLGIIASVILFYGPIIYKKKIKTKS